MIKKATRNEIKARNSFKGKRVFPAIISTVCYFFLLFIEILPTAITKNNCICALGIATV